MLCQLFDLTNYTCLDVWKKEKRSFQIKHDLEFLKFPGEVPLGPSLQRKGWLPSLISSLANMATALGGACLINGVIPCSNNVAWLLNLLDKFAFQSCITIRDDWLKQTWATFSSSQKKIHNRLWHIFTFFLCFALASYVCFEIWLVPWIFFVQ